MKINTINNFLKSVRKKQIALLIFTGIFICLSVQIALILLCASVIELFPFSIAGVVFAGLLTIGTLYVLIKRIVLPVSSVTYTTCALLVEKHNPFINNRLINSFLLANSARPHNSHFSQPLLNALIEDTNRILKDVELKKAFPLSTFTREFWKLCILGLFFSSTLYISPKIINDAKKAILHPVEYYDVFERTSSATATTAPETLPKIGDIELTYFYPSYTKLDPVEIMDSNGDINVLKGTEVLIKARISRQIESASLKLNKNTSIPMNIGADLTLQAKMIAMEDGEYYVEMVSSGKVVPEEIRHSIALIDDKYPEIELTFPEDHIEVNTADELELIYNYKDDFGVSKIKLIYDIEDKVGYSIEKGREALSDVSGKENEEKYTWNMALLNLKEGGAIRYHLEIQDNDLISGPKKAVSEEFNIKIYDSEEGHTDVIFNQEKVLEEMLTLLADKLESPITQRITRKTFIDEKTMDEHLVEILGMIESLISFIEKDTFANPMTSFSYKKIKTRLKNVNDEKKEKLQWAEDNMGFVVDSATAVFVRNLWDREVREIEMDIIEMDALIKKEKVNSLYKREEDLLDAQDSLLDLISSLSDMNKTDAMNKFEKSLKRIEDLFQKFMEKLGSMSKELPDEFVNSEAYKDVNPDEVRDIMKEIKEALENGDLDKAAQLAQDFVSQMDNMMTNLMETAEDMASDSLMADIEGIENAAYTAEKLLEEEKKLLEQTEPIDDKYKKKMEEMWQKKIDQFKKKIQTLSSLLKKRMKDLKIEARKQSILENMVRRETLSVEKKIDSMLELLDSDIAKARSLSKESERQLKKMTKMLNNVAQLNIRTKESNAELQTKAGETQEAGEAIREEFDRLIAKKNSLSKDDMKKMMEMAKMQSNIKNGTKTLKETLKGLDGAEMLLGEKMFNQLSEALKGMGKAEGGLNKGKLPGSLEGERDAMNNLSMASNKLNSLKEGLQNMKEGKGGIPSGMKIPGGRRPSGRKIRREKVDIPTGKDHKVPGKFRDEILKAMRGGVPGKYKDMNSRYYKELIK